MDNQNQNITELLETIELKIDSIQSTVTKLNKELENITNEESK